MATTERLFCTYDLRQVMDNHVREIAAEVDRAPEEHLLNVDEQAWIAALVERYRIEVPVLDVANWSIDPPQEIKVDVRYYGRDRAIFDRSQPCWMPGHRVVLHIPFTGERDVFFCQASRFSISGTPSAEVHASEVRLTIEYPHDAPVNVRAAAENFVRDAKRYLDYAASDVHGFETRLAQAAANAISARRRRLKTHYDAIAAAGIPIRGEQRSGSYIADAVVRRPSPLPTTAAHSKPMPLDPALSDEVYEHILAIMRSTARTMERSPDTYRALGEEDRRDVLLGALNSHYTGQAHAEAFNFGGKTDVLIRWENKNLFIAECKKWSGAKNFADTIDQLFGYGSWRDTKLALVFFVEQRDLSDILDKARAALSQHDYFGEMQDVDEEGEMRARMTWPGDPRRAVTMHVMFVHTPPRAAQAA